MFDIEFEFVFFLFTVILPLYLPGCKQDNYCLWLHLQSVANVELERDNFKRRWEAEQQAHKDTIDRYNADKKSISSISQANQIESRGQLVVFCDRHCVCVYVCVCMPVHIYVFMYVI